METYEISPKKFYDDVKVLAEKLKGAKFADIYAIPRGGVSVGLLLLEFLGKPLTTNPSRHTLIVDDLVDSGKTMSRFKTRKKAVLYVKPHSPKPKYWIEEIDGWIDFFYEKKEVDMSDTVIRTLEFIGEDPTREGLLKTPERVVRSWEKLYGGYGKDPKSIMTVFEDGACDEMVILRDIEFFSTCEHHMLPFFGKISIGYIPRGKVVGVSKLARLVEIFARRLQVQERLVGEIADTLMALLEPAGVMVIAEAKHLCMVARGVEKQNSIMTTSAIRGEFAKVEARNEFLTLIR